MEDLSRAHKAPLVPSAMDGGNMSFDNEPAMTAPGSEPITPLPQYMKTVYGSATGNLPQPQFTNETAIERPTRPVRGGDAGATRGTWDLTTGQPSPGGWDRT